MFHRTRFRWALPLVMALAIAGCSDDDTGTNPPPASLELNSGQLVGGAQYVHTFANAGTFPYHCENHPVMTGSITVATGGADSLVVHILNASSVGFAPATGTVRPGAYVRWHNMDATAHTVTSN